MMRCEIIEPSVALSGVLQTKEMDQLVDVTKDLFAIDRDEMLFQQIRLAGQ